MRQTVFMLAGIIAIAFVAEGRRGPDKKPSPTLDDYIAQAEQRNAAASMSPGSLYVATGPLANLSRDPRATQAGDLVTIIVADRASALSKGGTSSARTTSAKFSVGALAGATRVPGPWSDLARSSGDQQLKGEAETSRENNLTTTLSATVTHVLPNGLMVIQGTKQVMVNSEMQVVRVRGVMRREDVNSVNAIRSDRIAELEITVNGRGVVGDAIRRPFILYRILLGILPF